MNTRVKCLLPLLAAALIVAVGCSDKSNPSAASPSVTDLSAQNTAPAPAYTPQPMTPTPAYTPAASYAPTAAYAPTATYTPADAAPAPVMAASTSDSTAADVTPAMTASPAGQKYTVKKGDTLWKISARHYGNPKEWKKIAEANPKINPNKLKAGQVIVIP